MTTIVALILMIVDRMLMILLILEMTLLLVFMTNNNILITDSKMSFSLNNFLVAEDILLMTFVKMRVGLYVM